MEVERRQAQLLVEIAREAGDDVPMRPLSRLGDEEQARGVPIVGRGIRGAIRHTRARRQSPLSRVTGPERQGLREQIDLALKRVE
jgi:hypothetical protein